MQPWHYVHYYLVKVLIPYVANSTWALISIAKNRVSQRRVFFMAASEEIERTTLILKLEQWQFGAYTRCSQLTSALLDVLIAP